MSKLLQETGGTDDILQEDGGFLLLDDDLHASLTEALRCQEGPPLRLLNPEEASRTESLRIIDSPTVQINQTVLITEPIKIAEGPLVANLQTAAESTEMLFVTEQVIAVMQPVI